MKTKKVKAREKKRERMNNNREGKKRKKEEGNREGRKLNEKMKIKGLEN